MKKDVFQIKGDNMNSIVADTSFYSCFHCHLQDECLEEDFFKNYKYFIGPNIQRELPKNLKSHPEIHYEEYDYYALLEPLFERNKSHLRDGEYEAIGLAHYLLNKNALKYLIIDDRKPYKFTEKNFSYLNEYLTGTLGFITRCCINDSVLDKEKSIELLNSIKILVMEDKKQRPCSMDKKNYIKLIDPLIDQLERF